MRSEGDGLNMEGSLGTSSECVVTGTEQQEGQSVFYMEVISVGV